MGWSVSKAKSSCSSRLLLRRAETNEINPLHVEYSPGIFLRVPHGDVSFDDPELEGELTRGTVIRLEAVEGRVRITRGSFSEPRYVAPADLRPVVVLPKNQLADKRRDEWQRGDGSWFGVRFPIGGLPNVQATPGRYEP